MGQVQEPWFRRNRKCWYVWHGGKQVRLHPNKGEAYRMWHELLNKPVESALTLGQLIEEFLEDASERIKKETAKTYWKVTNQLPKEEIASSFDAKGWIKKQKEWSRSYRYTVVMMIKQIYKFAVNKGLLEVNPFHEWIVPGVTSRGATAVISKEEHEKVLTVAPSHYKDALNFMWYTGCRPSEMCNITAKDYLDGVVVLKTHKTSDKTNKPRLIILSEEAKEIIERLSKLYPSDCLFRTRLGSPMSPHTLQMWLHNNGKGRNGVKVIAYGYRHTYGTTALLNGIPDAIVAQLMGHTSTQTLHSHYAHLTARIQVLKDAANKVRPE